MANFYDIELSKVLSKRGRIGSPTKKIPPPVRPRPKRIASPVLTEDVFYTPLTEFPPVLTSDFPPVLTSDFPAMIGQPLVTLRRNPGPTRRRPTKKLEVNKSVGGSRKNRKGRGYTRRRY